LVQLCPGAGDRHIAGVVSYRIVPGHRVYRVEAVDDYGNIRVVGTWPTEDAAISHLKTLQEAVAAAGRSRQGPFEKDWRG
jgi:hypothetical protein